MLEDRPVLSRRITLVQDEKKLPGFQLLLPIYERGIHLETAERPPAGVAGMGLRLDPHR